MTYKGGTAQKRSGKIGQGMEVEVVDQYGDPLIQKLGVDDLISNKSCKIMNDAYGAQGEPTDDLPVPFNGRFSAVRKPGDIAGNVVEMR